VRPVHPSRKPSRTNETREVRDLLLRDALCLHDRHQLCVRIVGAPDGWGCYAPFPARQLLLAQRRLCRGSAGPPGFAPAAMGARESGLKLWVMMQQSFCLETLGQIKSVE
jgi:hypothetical protein